VPRRAINLRRRHLPLTTFVTQDSTKLWEWMADYESSTGGQVLAIPHNGNMSNGRIFEEPQFDGSPMTREWAETRAKYERLYEVTQIKGQSESHPTLSLNDEFAAWDLWDRGNLILKPKPEGAIKYEYWREALKSGMRIEAELGVNPFAYGANAATDTHTGMSTAEEGNLFGKFMTVEPSNKERWNFPLIEANNRAYMGWEQAASGVMRVWATANTREAIWDAMHRPETFATTGPKMLVRFFGCYDFGDSDLEGDYVAAGHDKGVPMGSDLGAAGKLPPVGDTVNRETATYENSIGDTELTAVFTDPEFDPSQRAVYYVQVLEIPTPRWTLYDKVRFGIAMDDEVPLVHQERGFSSPIWYRP
jgi:hypothetical protein